MFGSIGMPELILIFVVALLVFGPRKLPEIGKSLGKGLAEFKKASEDLKKTIEQETEDGKRELHAVAPAPPPAETVPRAAEAVPAGPAPAAEASPRPIDPA